MESGVFWLSACSVSNVDCAGIRSTGRATVRALWDPHPLPPLQVMSPTGGYPPDYRGTPRHRPCQRRSLCFIVWLVKLGSGDCVTPQYITSRGNRSIAGMKRTDVLMTDVTSVHCVQTPFRPTTHNPPPPFSSWETRLPLMLGAWAPHVHVCFATSESRGIRKRVMHVL